MQLTLSLSPSKILLFCCAVLTFRGVSYLAGKRSDHCDYAHPSVTIKHFAAIMDGNRRWAAERGLPSFDGHLEGVGAVERVIKFCLSKRISILSLYTFSLENLKRNKDEKDYLFTMLENMFNQWTPMFDKERIKVRFVGDRTQFDAKIGEIIEKIESKTAKHDGMLLNILFCYGGQQEIVAATKTIIAQVKSGKMKLESITPETFNQFTWTGDIPAPDIILRTGKRDRLSNFFTFQSSYSEIKFLDKFWPAVSNNDLENIYDEFVRTARTFGK